VCADSGTLPSEACPKRRLEVFAADQPPLGPEYDMHQFIDIDLNTGKRANEYCRANVETRQYIVFPPDGRQWAIEHGIDQPPEGFCPSTAINAKITSPADGDTVRGLVPIEGHAVAANFAYYELEYGVGTGPLAFGKLTEPKSQLVEGGVLGLFDTTQLPNGPYTVRLMVYDQTGGGLESRIRVLIDNLPTATPSPTETSTPTVTPTGTDTPTVTPTFGKSTATPTGKPTISITGTLVLPTNTPLPSATPTGTATPTPTFTLAPPTPTDTATATPTGIATPTPTLTVAPTPTMTIAPTITPTVTVSPTITATVVISNTIGQ